MSCNFFRLALCAFGVCSVANGASSDPAIRDMTADRSYHEFLKNAAESILNGSCIEYFQRYSKTPHAMRPQDAARLCRSEARQNLGKALNVAQRIQPTFSPAMPWAYFYVRTPDFDPPDLMDVVVLERSAEGRWFVEHTRTWDAHKRTLAASNEQVVSATGDTMTSGTAGASLASQRLAKMQDRAEDKFSGAATVSSADTQLLNDLTRSYSATCSGSPSGSLAQTCDEVRAELIKAGRIPGVTQNQRSSNDDQSDDEDDRERRRRENVARTRDSQLAMQQGQYSWTCSSSSLQQTPQLKPLCDTMASQIEETKYSQYDSSETTATQVGRSLNSLLQIYSAGQSRTASSANSASEYESRAIPTCNCTVCGDGGKNCGYVQPDGSCYKETRCER